VAFVAVTVKMDELPAEIEVGLAEMATVAGNAPIKLPRTHPVNSRGSKRPGITQERIERRDLPSRAFIKMLTFLTLSVDFRDVAIRGL
jgi:hypothetical protein